MAAEQQLNGNRSLLEEHLSALNEQKLKLYENQKYCDCSFKLGEEISQCHRVIIAAASQKLIGYWNDNRSQQEPAVLLDGVTYETFQAAMRFVYGCKTESLEKNFTLTKKVLKFACDWEIKYLKKAVVAVCFTFFLTRPYHLLELHHYFTERSLLEEAEKIMKVICDKGGAVLTMLKSPNGKAHMVHEDTIEALLQQDSINLFSEKDLYDAIVNWRNTREQEAGKVVNDFKKLLQRIRFKAFSKADFCCLLKEQEVDFLTKSVKNDLLEYCTSSGTGKTRHEPSSNLSELDVRSGHRGRFDPISAKKVCLNSITIPNLTGTRSQNMEVSANLYLLSVWLSSTSAKEVHVKIKHIKWQTKPSTNLSSSVKLAKSFDQVPKDNMIRLPEPFLLEAGITYYITVTDKKTRKYIKSITYSKFGCVNFQLTISGGKNVQFAVISSGAGNIGAFEFACPQTQNAI